MSKSYMLAQKYRPTQLDEIEGQVNVVRQLKGHFKTQSPKQAYFISGPTGTGKSSIARIIAKYANCENFDSAYVKSCEACAVCQEAKSDFKRKEAFWVLEVNFSIAGIDDVRAIIEETKYVSLQNKRVFILDEVQEMPPKAQNALLMILETQDPGCIFCICTTDEKRVIKPLKDRCFPLNLQPLPVPCLESLLSRVSKSEGLSHLNPEFFLHIAEDSRGVARNALVRLDQLISALQENPDYSLEDYEFEGLVDRTDSAVYAVRFIILCLKRNRNEAIAMLINLIARCDACPRKVAMLLELFIEETLLRFYGVGKKTGRKVNYFATLSDAVQKMADQDSSVMQRFLVLAQRFENSSKDANCKYSRLILLNWTIEMTTP